MKSNQDELIGVENLFPFYCSGWGIDKEAAIRSFRHDLKKSLKWIRGYKYWRTKPIYKIHQDFDSDLVEHTVSSRIVSFDRVLDDVKMERVELDCEIEDV